MFTESVRSFHVPATPFTFAWPPSLPSVPTSRATRVTSAAKESSWATIRFTVLAVLRNSPCSGRSSTSMAIVCERSPCATAPITRAVSLVGCTRSSIKPFTDAADSCQKPVTSPRTSRWLSLPSLPTTRLSRFISEAMRSFSSTTSLKASASFPSTPVHSEGSRTPGFPFFRSIKASSRVAVCVPLVSVGSCRISMAMGIGESMVRHARHGLMGKEGDPHDEKGLCPLVPVQGMAHDIAGWDDQLPRTACPGGLALALS